MEVYKCTCSSNEKEILFIQDLEEKVIFCQIHLAMKHSFIQRLVIGFKYIFGYKSPTGNWDEFILTKDHKEQVTKAAKFLSEC